MLRVAITFALCAVACTFSPSGSQSGDAGGSGADGRHNDAHGLDASDLGTCSDGLKNGNELEVDCGGRCSACTKLFDVDSNALAIFELNGDASDSSGNGRDATLLGGSFVTTSWGHGLSVPGDAAMPQGLDWSDFADLLVHPYTIEMVVRPADVRCWKKLFGPDDNSDVGWHYCTKFETYPNNTVGPDLSDGARNYFALVSTAADKIDVYIDGARVGNLDASFTAPPSQAIFFRDDTTTGRLEQLSGVIDAVRISKVARSAAEITAVQLRLAAQP